MKNRKEAFEDAISAAKAAAEEGIVPGGGVALLGTIVAVELEEKECEGDERTGVRIPVTQRLRDIVKRSSGRCGISSRTT